MSPGSWGRVDPGTWHPESLTEPDVNLSAHPALVIKSSVLNPVASRTMGGTMGGTYLICHFFQPCRSGSLL